jgi:hypothetical protein
LKTRSFLSFPNPHPNAAVDCGRAGALWRAGRGGGLPREKPEFRGPFVGALPFSSRLHPSQDPEPSFGGLGVVAGEGAAVFPRTFRKPPCGGGRAPNRGRGSRPVGVEARVPDAPDPHGWPTGSELESGSNRLFKLPECVRGEGSARRRTGSNFSRFAPSPTLPGPHACPCSGWGGARAAGEGALSARGGRGGSSQKRDKRGGGGGTGV